MPWPKKISMFGKGSGKMKPPVGGSSLRMPPTDILRKVGQEMRARDRAEFIKEAALIMLQNLPPNTVYRPGSIAENARVLYEAVQDEINHGEGQ